MNESFDELRAGWKEENNLNSVGITHSTGQGKHMGHERVGTLPKTKRWYGIVSNICAALEGEMHDTATLTSTTLNEVKDRYKRISYDPGVQAAFAYLVALSTNELSGQGGLTDVDTKLAENPSPIRITSDLADWVNKHKGSHEYAELASRAAADTIAKWTRENSKQKLLFDDAARANNIWSKTDGSSFCNIARTFFSKLTERYLRYFIERSASSETKSLRARQVLNDNISNHINDISKHAFETSKITQSFAAGWFNKYAKDRRPNDKELSNFLTHAFGKLHEELTREDINP